MFGLEMLDVLIGLMTVYFMFGIACTSIVEAISAGTGFRSKNLEAALNELFSGELAPNTQFVTQFFDHPLIQSLSKGNAGRPSYIPSAIVGQVVQALVIGRSAMSTLSARVNALPGSVEDNRIKGVLDTLVMQTGNDTDKFRKAVEAQFDAAMDRASGWYKRRTQTITLIVAAFLVSSANVDTINLATLLAANPVAREQMLVITEQYTRESPHRVSNDPGSPPVDPAEKARTDFNQAMSAVQSVGFSLGWKTLPIGWGYLTKAIGLLITIFAVSLGGPFWFDILQRVMQIRSTGPKPPEPGKSRKKNT